ncbi:MAG: hypothetical protein R3F44_09635 [Candidatus Competibacteraceae bacterium]
MPWVIKRSYDRIRTNFEALALYRQAAFAAQQADAPESLYRWQWQIGRLLKYFIQGNRDGAILAYQQAVDNLQAIRQDFITSRTNSSGSFRSGASAMLSSNWPTYYWSGLPSSPRMLLANRPIGRPQHDGSAKPPKFEIISRDECATAPQSRTVTLDRRSCFRVPPSLYPPYYPTAELLLDTPRDLQQITIRMDRDTPYRHHPRVPALPGKTHQPRIPPARATVVRLADSTVARRTGCPENRYLGDRA